MTTAAPPQPALRRFLENLKAAPLRVRDAAFRGGAPTSDRTRSSFVFGNVFLHLHAVRTHRHSLRWATTFGLGIAAKLYPALLLAALFLLCLRAGRLGAWLRTTVAAVVTWAVVNAPIALLAPENWRRFFALNSSRPADPDTVWNILLTATDHRLFDGPLAEGYRAARGKGPVVDFFRDYEIALAMMNRFMTPGPGTAAIFLGGGVPKDFIQITATSVSTLRGAEACPHVAAIQITTDNPVYGGLGGAGVNSEAISWGKEAADGDNVMVFADVTIALPLLCQGLLERYGPRHVRAARAGIRRELAALQDR